MLDADNIHLLYVEDSKVARDLLARAVAPIVHFHGAGSIAEARQVLAEQPIGVFILDYELPDGNGVDFAGELRQTDAHARTPMLLYASSVDNELAFQAMKAGINESIQKPMPAMELCQRIVTQIELPEIKHVRRQLLQLTCMVWKVDGKWHEYSPDLNLLLRGDDPKTLEAEMQQRLEAELLAKANPDDYPADIKLLKHVVQLRSVEESAESSDTCDPSAAPA